jgi:hypothetical protein
MNFGILSLYRNLSSRPPAASLVMNLHITQTAGIIDYLRNWQLLKKEPVAWN